MFQSHREFRYLTDVIRDVHDRIRLQCKESTNAFTFRIHSILDVAKVRCPNEDMRTIIRRHKKYWPYKSLADRQDKDGVTGPAASAEDKGLQGLLAMEQTRRLTLAEKRKLEAAKKKLQQQRQEAFEAPQELDNKEIIGNVLKQLIETRLHFVHQKFIVNFLVFQTKQLRKELNIREEILTPSLLSNASSPLTAKRSGHARRLRDGESARDFQNQYKAVMEHNQQNYRNVPHELQEAAEAAQAAQEDMLLQNAEDPLEAEDRHHGEAYRDYHNNEKRRI